MRLIRDGDTRIGLSLSLTCQPTSEDVNKQHNSTAPQTLAVRSIAYAYGPGKRVRSADREVDWTGQSTLAAGHCCCISGQSTRRGEARRGEGDLWPSDLWSGCCTPQQRPPARPPPFRPDLPPLRSARGGPERRNNSIVTA